MTKAKSGRVSVVSKAAAGAKWVFVGRLLDRVVRFGTMVVLSRVLLPEEFGLFVLALSVAGVVTYVRSLGVDAALIRRQDAFEPQVSQTAFTLLSCGGVILYTAFYLIAPLISKLFGNVSLLPVIRAVSVSIIIGAVSRVPLALLRKRMAFKSVALAEVLGRLAFSAVAIVLALSGLGVWSVVTGYLARQGVTAVAIFVRSKWSPRFSFEPVVARELMGYGRFIVGSSLLHYVENNLDKMIVGRWAGTASLGLYGLAFNLASLVNAQLVQPLRQVMFPAYSEIQDDLGALKRAYLKSIKYIVFLGAPVCVGLMILAPEIIEVVYTDRWIGAVPALQVLAVYGFVRSILGSSAPMLRALGHPSTEFRLIGLNVALIAPLMIPAVKTFGIAGAGGAMLLSVSIVILFLIRALKGLLGVYPKDVLQVVAPGSLCAGVMGLVLVGVKWNLSLLDTPLGSWALPLAIVGGGLIYSVGLWLIDRDEVLRLRTLLMSRMSSG